jgi:hypothetical protein
MTRRALVLTDEIARHSFLRSLPPHVRRIEPEGVPKPTSWRINAVDVRQFLMAYCATFLAVTVFIL